jgi:hypothetical protein
MLEAVADCCPALLPIAMWAYKQPSHLLVRKSGGAMVSFQCGVRQGDPLGPLPFTLQGPLQQVAQLQLAEPLAYDMFLQGPPVPVTEAFHTLVQLATLLGLHVRQAFVLQGMPARALRTGIAMRAVSTLQTLLLRCQKPCMLSKPGQPPGSWLLCGRARL